MADKQTPAAPAEKQVRIYNRFTSRTLIHGEHRAVPSTFATVPESVAKLWMDHFPNDIVEANIAQKELTGATVELAETKAKLAEAEAKIKALEAAAKGGKKGIAPI